MSQTIESKLFTWTSWDLIAAAVFQFHDVSLVQDIGDLKSGSKFAIATINYEESFLEFYDLDGEDSEAEAILRGKFHLSLQVSPTPISDSHD